MLLLILLIPVSAIDFNVSKKKIHLEIHEWSNFTLSYRAEAKSTLFVEIKSDDSLKVFPKNLEVYLNNLSHFQQSFKVQGLTPKRTLLEIKMRTVESSEYRREDFIVVDIVRFKFLEHFSGWMKVFHFFFGSLAFYPQILSNFINRSSEAVSKDYVLISLLGQVFGFAILFVSIKERNPGAASVSNKIFSVHAFLVTLILSFQVFISYKQEQKLCLCTKRLVILSILVLLIILVLYLTTTPNMKFFIGAWEVFLHSVKYIPQLWKNYQRKSTRGWNIWGIVFEQIALVFLLFFQLTTSFNFGSWNFFMIDAVLSLVLIFYDCIFIWQELIYKKKYEEELNVTGF